MVNITEIMRPVGVYLWYEKRNKKKNYIHIYTISEGRTASAVITLQLTD